jgi:hypothetical protein
MAKHLYLLTILLTGLAACQPDKSAIIQQKIAARVTEFSKKERAKCRESLLSRANELVDSMLLAEAQQQLRDSLGRARPSKPIQPPDVPPIDSAEIKPIFEQPKKQ